ncbi:hypothetical protein O181_107428 [Austropuccinia psidii MF-1]|uniref:Uncharacterized protein n=1 Tax=Austropuccinia psidii MF-1 TaxID=1389203 RepID=A0A9Q3JQU9_9BASI|nr:hypothetical protein [Austropuccinia psidii MF-1]
MAFLGHLGPLQFYGPWAVIHGPGSVGVLGPFWPNPMRPKGAKGGNHLGAKARWVPNHNWAHLSQSWPSIPWTPNLAINPSGPKFGHRPSGTTFKPLASGNPQRPPDQLSQPFAQPKGNSFHSSLHPVLKVAGVVHIWYYMPFCTIFDQQSNGDVLRTISHLSNSRS